MQSDKKQINSHDLSMYLNSSVLDTKMQLYTRDKLELASDLNSFAEPFYPPLSGVPNLLNVSKNSFSIVQETISPKSPTLNKLALTILDEKDKEKEKEKEQDLSTESDLTVLDYPSKPSLPTHRSLCKYDQSCTRPVCQFVHPIEWYKLSTHFTRIETIHMNEYNDIIKYKLQYPSLYKIYKSLAETHLKIAENAKIDAEKYMSDESHLTFNLKENLNFFDSKSRSSNGSGANRSSSNKQYLDEAPVKRNVSKPYESGMGASSGTNIGSNSRLRPERVPRGQLRNTNVDSFNYNDSADVAGGGSYVPKGRGSSSGGKMYSMEEIEAHYVYKQRDDLFSSKKNTGSAYVEPIEKVHYPKVFDHVKNSQVNTSSNWRSN